ncbi:hypothetical protein [Rubellicoccus peritrichatus]|uniref:Single Cache domain-containing protein n=1 Tax=Rubellicoccus peritrichatus TaxID=3080537 RepID=A0AAQ3QVB2_9BACT|nr:hypothetical protein [Puniceicoccus sp. CR14]WOO43261.1 hypothetical protein RZN69_09180 [Puniceicoccus sp. CR14]
MKLLFLLAGISIIITSIRAQELMEQSTFATSYQSEQISASQVIYMINKAADLLKKDPEAAIKAFQQNDTGPWNRDNFGLFVLHVNSGEIVASPSSYDNKDEAGYFLDPREINGKAFAHAAMVKTLDNTSKTYTRNLHIVHDPFNDGSGDFYVMTLPNLEGHNYVLCAGQENWGMERQFVQKMVSDAVDLVQISGEKAFETFNKQSWIFQFPKSHIFVLNSDGSLAYDSGFNRTLAPSKYTKDESAFVFGIIGKVMNQRTGMWTYDTWPVRNQKLAEEGYGDPKWYYAKAATYRGKTYIVGTGLHATDPDAAAKFAQDKN